MASRRGDPPTPAAPARVDDNAAPRRFPLARGPLLLPSSGSRFRDAMVSCGYGSTLAAYQRLNLRTVIPRGTVGALTDGERSTLDTLQDALESHLVTLLRYGYVRATTFLPGSLEAVPVPAAWWEGASVDRVANTAASGGTTLVKLLIYAVDGAIPTEDRPAEPPKQAQETCATEDSGTTETRGRKGDTRERVKHEMLDHLRKGERTLVDLRKNQKQTAGWYGVSRGTMVAALRAVSEIVKNNPDIYRTNNNL